MQDGKKIENSKNVPLGHDSLTDESCKAQKDLFGEPNDFASNGGMEGMGKAMDRGMVLVMSIGTTAPRTCSGWTPPTLSTRLVQAPSEDPATPTRGIQSRCDTTTRMPM